MPKLDADVIVVGGGNAAFSAALAAQDAAVERLLDEDVLEHELEIRRATAFACGRMPTVWTSRKRKAK